MSIFNQVNILGVGPQDKKQFIEFQKFYSGIMKEKRNNNKKSRCFICKKEKSFCQSHTIPRFVLKNIAENGKLNNIQVFNYSKLYKDETGIANTNTFFLLCSDCDGSKFQDYENQNNIEQLPSQKVMKQIALKTHISRIAKHNKEKKILSEILKIDTTDNLYASLYKEQNIKARLQVANTNYNYHAKQANTVLKNLNLNNDIYKCLYYKQLNYVVPYTIQSSSCITVGFGNDIIVDSFDILDINLILDLHFCIFPLEDKSVIFIFCRNDINCYDTLFEEINKKDENQQLQIINFIAFAYFEDIFLHKKIDKNLIDDNILSKLVFDQLETYAFKTLVQGIGPTEIKREKLKSISENLSLDNAGTIPCLLDSKYKINLP